MVLSIDEEPSWGQQRRKLCRKTKKTAKNIMQISRVEENERLMVESALALAQALDYSLG
jgi:hypothetical protein